MLCKWCCSAPKAWHSSHNVLTPSLALNSPHFHTLSASRFSALMMWSPGSLQAASSDSTGQCPPPPLPRARVAGSNQGITRQLKAALTLLGHSCGATVAVLVANGPLDGCQLQANLGACKRRHQHLAQHCQAQHQRQRNSTCLSLLGKFRGLLEELDFVLQPLCWAWAGTIVVQPTFDVWRWFSRLLTAAGGNVVPRR